MNKRKAAPPLTLQALARKRKIGLDTGLLAILSILFFVIYLVPTWIVYRNLYFRLPIKVIYSVTVMPLFLVGMFLNHQLVEKYLPVVLNFFASIPQRPSTGKQASLVAFIITCPIPIFCMYCWYRICRFLDSKIFHTVYHEKVKEDLVRQGAQAAWVGAFAFSLLFGLLVGAGISDAFPQAGTTGKKSIIFFSVIFCGASVIIFYVYRKKLAKINNRVIE